MPGTEMSPSKDTPPHYGAAGPLQTPLAPGEQSRISCDSGPRLITSLLSEAVPVLSQGTHSVW